MKRVIIEILRKHLDKPYWGDEEGKPDGNIEIMTPLEMMCDSQQEVLAIAEEIIVAMWGCKDTVKIPTAVEVKKWMIDHLVIPLNRDEYYVEYMTGELLEWMKEL